MSTGRQKDEIVGLQPHLILESPHGHGYSDLFCGMKYSGME